MTAALETMLQPLPVETDSLLADFAPGVLTDAEIKGLARTSRGAALDRVVRKYGDKLAGHAQYILHDAQAARDIVQEVFIKAMREPRFFDEDFKIQAWLYRVTRNLCFNVARDRRRRDVLLSTPEGKAVVHPTTASLGPDPLAAVFEDERREEILAAVELLSTDHREILLLRYYEDLSYAEIAERLEIKLGTVMSRLSRARDRLVERLPPTLAVRAA